MSLSALLNDPEALEKDLQESASSKEDFEGKMAGLAYGNGLMTAIIAGPEPVPQTEWLPMLLNSADAALDDEDTRLLTGMILAQYGAIIKSLRSRSKPYKPLFWKDGEGRLITSDWARGFLDGMRLREEPWEELRKDKAQTFFALLAVLFQDGGIDAQLLEDGLDPKEFFEDALGRCLIGFKHSTVFGKSARPVTGAPDGKVGRNDPCLCGSGKKYKKCCLN